MSPAVLRELEGTLYWLRWCAVVGQAVSLLFAAQQLGLQLPWAHLLAGVAALAVANGIIAGRRRRADPGEARVLGGLALDLAVLTWALFNSGGVMNPFTMLYLLPVALTAGVLPATRVLALALAGVCGYALLLRWAPPLPHLHAQGALDLHLAGMTVNFLLSMAVLCAFGLHLARLRRRHAEALREARERGLRDEGMHALALQAAMAAHSVNTPLATMAVLVDELRAVPPSGEQLRSDLDLLAGQLGHARDAMRSLVDGARAEPAKSRPFAEVLASLAARAALLRPAVPLRVEVGAALADRPVRMPPVLLASLGNLLDNAADASLGDPQAEVVLVAEDESGSDAVQLLVLDRGSGAPHAGIKRDGMGWGLALANATLEHHGGTLHRRDRERGGSEFRVRLPWRALEPEP